MSIRNHDIEVSDSKDLRKLLSHIVIIAIILVIIL